MLDRLFDSPKRMGVGLALAIAAGLLVANSPVADSYSALLHKPVRAIWPLSVQMDLLQWLNEGLLTAYFFLIGLGLRRQLLHGELSRPGAFVLPVLAALGGASLAAALYWLLNGDGAAYAGWGIPMATDLPLAIGLLSLLGTRINLALKVFLATVAVVDDLLAVLVIALGYESQMNMPALWGGLGCLLVSLNLSAFRVHNPLPYTLLALSTWLLFLHSGIQSAVAGVLVALTLPLTPDSGVWERRLGGLCSLLIIPLFALANLGLVWTSDPAGESWWRVFGGICLGLCVGKPLGVLMTTVILVKSGLSDLPKGVRWRQMIGASILSGLSFTIGLYVASLAFRSETLLSAARLAVLISSLFCGILGLTVLHRSTVANVPSQSA